MLRLSGQTIAAVLLAMLGTPAVADGYNRPVEGQRALVAPPPAGTSYTAVVGATGRLIRGSGATSASQPEGTGTYEVDFESDVTGCAYVATLGQTGSKGQADPGMITVVGRSGNSAGIYITTGNIHGAHKNRSFHVDVGC
jgi:hypothetical protein